MTWDEVFADGLDKSGPLLYSEKRGLLDNFDGP